MKGLLRCAAAILLLFVGGCGASTGMEKASQSAEPMVLGWIQRSDFMNATFPRFQEVYDSAQIEDQFIEMIRELQAGVEVVVVLGTWCSDSKTHVPRFLKIADRAGILDDRIRFYGVDRSKKSADGVPDRYRIERVPTFLFFKDGREVGRIVEAPRNSLEEDILVLLAEQHAQ